jgi:predicted metalloprotease with PDZ domain
MRKRTSPVVLLVAFVVGFVGPASYARSAQAPAPIVYAVKFPEPDKHYALVEATIPTDGRAAVELMMPVWSPGYYRVENYAKQVQDLAARTPDGKELATEQPLKNRWKIPTRGAPTVVVSYRLPCNRLFVTSNWVGDDMAVLNGAASFLTLVEKTRRPHDVKLTLPAAWKRSMTGLEAAPGGQPHHYRAADYDMLVDCPIVAGSPDVRDFTVADSKHSLVHAGKLGDWHGQKAAADVEKIVAAHRRMWGFLPFDRYVFLCVFGKGGGGLEHKNSTLVTTNAGAMRTPKSYLAWLGLVSHEYFHAFNVKRLRPVELGPFDYEKEPRTSGLWVAEGLTSYYGDLILARSGLADDKEYLARLSGHINNLQKTPGRLVQSLEQASLDVWTSSFSGIGGGEKSISYYVKGPVVGFLLDAKIRRATKGAKSLDDLMRLAYKRYSGEKGFTAEQFRQAADEVAGVDVGGWIHKAVATTEELDYKEALDWFGLRFAPAEEGAKKTWRLEVRPDATDEQRGHLRTWLSQ